MCPACLLGIKSACTERHHFNPETGKFMSCIDWANYQTALEPNASPVGEFSSAQIEASEFESDAITQHVQRERGPGGGFHKDDATLKQPARVGRQRANRAKPIKPGDVCEWSELKYAGGGPVPITGCFRGVAATVHHGPDKDWLNNDLSNLHKICTQCHSMYHIKNDMFYVSERPTPGTPFLWNEDMVKGLEIKPHDPDTKATIQEIYAQIAERRGEELLESEDVLVLPTEEGNVLP